ncbi:MAG: hypothetical protein ACE366_17295 [Bradymonadia bacterium]
MNFALLRAPSRGLLAFSLALLTLSLGLSLNAPVAHGRSPAKALKGRVILSTTPFPFKFKSNSAFIKHMKKVDTKAFNLEKGRQTNVELMAFFGKAIKATEVTATIYDITEKPQEMVETFPIYLQGNKAEQIVASNFALDLDSYKLERRYMLVITMGYRGKMLAKTTFAVKATAAQRAAMKAEQKAAQKAMDME